jgi:hypothetical protein
VNDGIYGLCVYMYSLSDYVYFNKFYDEHVRIVKEIILHTKDKLMKY